MTEFSVVSTERLFEVLDIITPITWPADATTVIPDIVAKLGWSITKGDPSTHVSVESDLQVNFRNTTFLIGTKFAKGELLEITFWVTDVLPDGEDATCVHSAFSQILKDMSGRFGKAHGKPRKKWWDLPTGGRVRVEESSAFVTVDLLSLAYATIERDEARHGISGNRVLGEDE